MAAELTPVFLSDGNDFTTGFVMAMWTDEQLEEAQESREPDQVEWVRSAPSDSVCSDKRVLAAKVCCV